MKLSAVQGTGTKLFLLITVFLLIKRMEVSSYLFNYHHGDAW